MRILITNDDGILAPGIEALYRAVADLGDVDVVAPETPQSASGHGITVRLPMAVRRVHVNNVFWGWSVDGRPADCVKLALVELLPERPDFVISGINAGLNTGINVLYSGTVAGAVEGACFGIPAMAVSLELSDELNFPMAGKIARAVFERYLAAPHRPLTCLNVNIPALEAGWPLGTRCCPQGTAPMEEEYTTQLTPDGHKLYWLEGRFPDEIAPETDQAAIRDRYVSITPLRFNMTDAAALAQISGWKWPERFP